MGISIGVDIGQAQDPTAMVVVESYRPEAVSPTDRPEMHFLIRWVEKVPLGTPYPDVVAKIAAVAEQASIFGHPSIVVDSTGVGRPVIDMLKMATRFGVTAVTFTGGASEHRDGAYAHTVPKRDLVASLEVLLQTRRLHAAANLPFADDLRAELSAFEVNVSARGHDTYEAASGRHDDLVAALCLACWHASRPGAVDGVLEMWKQNAAARARR